MFIGKWHLSFISQPTYTYDSAVDTVKDCGFDTVDGLYIENLADDEDEFNNYRDGTFSHNLEWLTQAAVKVIEDESDKVRPCSHHYSLYHIIGRVSIEI